MSQSEIDRLYRTYGFIIYGRCINILRNRDDSKIGEWFEITELDIYLIKWEIRKMKKLKRFKKGVKNET